MHELHFRCLWTEQTWRAFYEAHFAASPRLKIPFYLGAAMVLGGSIGIGGSYPHKALCAAVLLAGLCCVLSRPLLVARSMRAVRAGAKVMGVVDIRVGEEGIGIEGPGLSVRQGWDEICGSRRVKAGLMFYADDNNFFFIPVEALAEGDEDRVLYLLRFNKVRQLG